ncbi:MAG: UDP-N-acetylglucosamine 2-epimerase (non-hydrolyzing) [Bacteroidales bacterium]|nr:UDP-N-acetylglucosamine 2-epimerase (non-hydrolyzing) [Bacteroidales bacterium]MCF8454712.1 UDP-N-acetylglucosamine 2-epimerase (non-hydrolyzing) [Bacteroidales bacterium]
MIKSKKIISVVGARPQFIKLAPLSEKLSLYHEEIILHTGQHYDKQMSDSFFEDLKIKKPKYNLNIGSGNHGAQTGRMMEEIENILLKEKPDMIIVFGDTNSTLAGALAAAKLHIKVLHIEAGLRSYNRSMPEEINRIATDHVSDFLFAPTQTAMDILKKEGLADKSFLTGDIMIDTVNRNISFAEQKADPKLLSDIQGEFYLVTLHRPYNVDRPEVLSKIMETLAALDHDVIFPVHPRTRKMIAQFNIPSNHKIHLIDPCGYLDFLYLQSKSKKIITDSGGIQKEAYTLKKPCITLRPETEWVETVKEGWNLLMNPETDLDAQKIIDFIPRKEQSNIFGSEVTQSMVEIINSL